MPLTVLNFARKYTKKLNNDIFSILPYVIPTLAMLNYKANIGTPFRCEIFKSVDLHACH